MKRWFLAVMASCLLLVHISVVVSANSTLFRVANPSIANLKLVTHSVVWGGAVILEGEDVHYVKSAAILWKGPDQTQVEIALKDLDYSIPGHLTIRLTSNDLPLSLADTIPSQVEMGLYNANSTNALASFPIQLHSSNSPYSLLMRFALVISITLTLLFLFLIPFYYRVMDYWGKSRKWLRGMINIALSPNGEFSLSRLQAVLWFCAVVPVYMFSAIGSGTLFAYPLDERYLMLMGSSGFTYFLSKWIHIKRKLDYEGKEVVNPTPTYGQFFQEYNGKERSVPRLSLFIITLLGLVYFYWSFFQSYTLPILTESQFTILLAAQGIYLTSKGTAKPKKDKRSVVVMVHGMGDHPDASWSTKWEAGFRRTTGNLYDYDSIAYDDLMKPSQLKFEDFVDDPAALLEMYSEYETKAIKDTKTKDSIAASKTEDADLSEEDVMQWLADHVVPLLKKVTGDHSSLSKGLSFAFGHLADVSSVLRDDEAFKAISDRFYFKFKKLMSDPQDSYDEVVLLGHSLGSVVIYAALMHLIHTGKMDEIEGWRKKLKGVVFMGSHIPIHAKKISKLVLRSLESEYRLRAERLKQLRVGYKNEAKRNAQTEKRIRKIESSLVHLKKKANPYTKNWVNLAFKFDIALPWLFNDKTGLGTPRTLLVTDGFDLNIIKAHNWYVQTEEGQDFTAGVLKDLY
jgi:hypothetical protein